jgi:hypothetical protein
LQNQTGFKHKTKVKRTRNATNRQKGEEERRLKSVFFKTYKLAILSCKSNQTLYYRFAMRPPGTSSGSGSTGNAWDSPHAWGNSRGCPYYNADNARNRRGYPTLAVPESNGLSATEVGQWALRGVRRNPPPTYLAPMSLYTTPQRANSKPEQSKTQSTAVPGLGLALRPVFQGAVAAPVRSPSNP